MAGGMHRCFQSTSYQLHVNLVDRSNTWVGCEGRKKGVGTEGAGTVQSDARMEARFEEISDEVLEQELRLLATATERK